MLNSLISHKDPRKRFYNLVKHYKTFRHEFYGLTLKIYDLGPPNKLSGKNYDLRMTRNIEQMTIDY